MGKSGMAPVRLMPPTLLSSSVSAASLDATRTLCPVPLDAPAQPVVCDPPPPKCRLLLAHLHAPSPIASARTCMRGILNAKHHGRPQALKKLSESFPQIHAEKLDLPMFVMDK